MKNTVDVSTGTRARALFLIKGEESRQLISRPTSRLSPTPFYIELIDTTTSPSRTSVLNLEVQKGRKVVSGKRVPKSPEISAIVKSYFRVYSYRSINTELTHAVHETHRNAAS